MAWSLLATALLHIPHRNIEIVLLLEKMEEDQKKEYQIWRKERKNYNDIKKNNSQ